MYADTPGAEIANATMNARLQQALLCIGQWEWGKNPSGVKLFYFRGLDVPGWRMSPPPTSFSRYAASEAMSIGRLFREQIHFGGWDGFLGSSVGLIGEILPADGFIQPNEAYALRGDIPLEHVEDLLLGGEI